MECENCKIDHNGDYGSGRFCSAECARGFSTKNKRKEINEKVSKKLKGVIQTKKEQKEISKNIKNTLQTKTPEAIENWRKTYYINRDKLIHKMEQNLSFEELPGWLRDEKIKNEQNWCCNKCKNSEWMGTSITLELEHINGNNKDNRRENLEYLCPNCHALTDTWRGRNKNRNSKFVSDEELMVALDKSPNIRQALLLVGLSAKGNNYSRAKRLKER